MSALTNTPDLSKLTDRQKQIFEMSEGLGEWNGKPHSAQEIATELGVTTNNVYVTRRRAKQILGLASETTHRAKEPKRILRSGAGGLETALDALERQRDDYKDEEASLRARLDQIERERPEVESTIERLKAVMGIEVDEAVEVG